MNSTEGQRRVQASTIAVANAEKSEIETKDTHQARGAGARGGCSKGGSRGGCQEEEKEEAEILVVVVVFLIVIVLLFRK
jgi:hypothetical protein